MARKRGPTPEEREGFRRYRIERQRELRILRTRYGALCDDFTRILAKHDPIALVLVGFNDDEYEIEARMILLRLGEISSEHAFRALIIEVFERMFAPAATPIRRKVDKIVAETWPLVKPYATVQHPKGKAAKPTKSAKKPIRRPPRRLYHE